MARQSGPLRILDMSITITPIASVRPTSTSTIALILFCERETHGDRTDGTKLLCSIYDRKEPTDNQVDLQVDRKKMNKSTTKLDREEKINTAAARSMRWATAGIILASEASREKMIH